MRLRLVPKALTRAGQDHVEDDSRQRALGLGLGSALRVAWGKNNAAYMIIKMHRQDPTVDLAPAQKMLEEGLDIAEATA